MKKRKRCQHRFDVNGRPGRQCVLTDRHATYHSLIPEPGTFIPSHAEVWSDVPQSSNSPVNPTHTKTASKQRP